MLNVLELLKKGEKLMKKIAVLLKAILAGFCIAVGGTVYLSLMATNKPLGAFMFAIGLFLIFCYGFNLFTGKVGFVFDNGAKFIPDLCIIWVGNFIGTTAVGLALSKLTRVSDLLVANAQGLCEAKLGDSVISMFVLGIFCGFLMFVAADNYKSGQSPLQKFIATFLPVAVFILAGFEHCVANMYYFAVAGIFSPDMLMSLLVVTLGNAVGAFIVPLCRRVYDKYE